MTWKLNEFVDPEPAAIEPIKDALKGFNEITLGDYTAKPLLVTSTAENGEILGGIYGWLQFGWLYIHLLWVSEAYRRKGIGTSLIGRLEALACKHGIYRCRLATADFQPGYHLYRHVGYETFAEIPFTAKESADSHTEYLMWKHLPLSEESHL